jgi:hypothetical protein
MMTPALLAILGKCPADSGRDDLTRHLAVSAYTVGMMTPGLGRRFSAIR